MKRTKVGIVGWRGMVGSVLLRRMQEEGDFNKFDSVFFSTTQAGKKSQNGNTIQNSYDLKTLSNMDIIVTCQGSDYTKSIYQKLRKSGWNGYWVDAASLLRMEKNAAIVLDNMNRDVIKNAIKKGMKDFIGGNCTTSLMLTAIGNLFKSDIVKWASVMSYQAISGAGAEAYNEYLDQTKTAISKINLKDSWDLIDKKLNTVLHSKQIPKNAIGNTLFGNVLPWIDSDLENGQSREEWKLQAETNKILATKNTISIDGICVRVGVMRSHSQAITIELKKKLSIEEIENVITKDNPYVEIVPNNKTETMKKLHPLYVSGTLKTVVGRIKKLSFGKNLISLFTVGDQLTWSAEPLRRVLNILLEVCYGIK